MYIEPRFRKFSRKILYTRVTKIVIRLRIAVWMLIVRHHFNRFSRPKITRDMDGDPVLESEEIDARTFRVQASVILVHLPERKAIDKKSDPE